jgi:high-affinity iron transporter
VEARTEVLPSYLIGLREGLEASLIVSILIAYLVKFGRKDQLRPVWGGVFLAIAVSAIFGAVLTYSSTSLLSTGTQQEAFGGLMSLVAVCFVTAMIFWMRRTAGKLHRELTGRLAAAVQVSILAVALTAFVAVAREGLETALFMWSAVRAAGQTRLPLIGFGLGILTAVVLAYLLYKRSVTLDLERFFTWTGIGLVIVAAGVLGYAIHDLQEGNVLPGLFTLAFDVRHQIPPTSWYGTLLKGTVNFTPNTTVLQAVAHGGYLAIVLTVFLRGMRGRVRPRTKEQSDNSGPVSAAAR